MKLYLVCLGLLLVSLGKRLIGQFEKFKNFECLSFIESFQPVSFIWFPSASAQPSPQPVSKLLYSNGHIIAEGLDLDYLQYQLYTDRNTSQKYLSFNIAHFSDMILRQNPPKSAPAAY